MDTVDWKVEQLLVLCEYKNLRTCLISNKQHNKNLWTSLLISSLIIFFYMIDDVVQD